MSKPIIKSELSWDEYYLSLAEQAAKKSKDPNTKVGALVVKNNKAVPGYNGFPRGVIDYEYRWQRPEKYNWVVHAECNAILTARMDLEGATIYITHHSPCGECAKIIIQAGIKRVVCGSGILSPATLDRCKESLVMFEEAGVKMERINGKNIGSA
jgi:dCMP deaminase